MTLINTTTMAMMSSKWIKPPSVVEVTIPSNHRISKITKIVQSICRILSITSFEELAATLATKTSCCVLPHFAVPSVCNSRTSSAEATGHGLCTHCVPLPAWKLTLIEHDGPRRLQVACEPNRPALPQRSDHRSSTLPPNPSACRSIAANP